MHFRWSYRQGALLLSRKITDELLTGIPKRRHAVLTLPFLSAYSITRFLRLISRCSSVIQILSVSVCHHHDRNCPAGSVISHNTEKSGSKRLYPAPSSEESPETENAPDLTGRGHSEMLEREPGIEPATYRPNSLISFGFGWSANRAFGPRGPRRHERRLYELRAVSAVHLERCRSVRRVI